MFEMTATTGAPTTVRLSFWQWMKAGMGFTLGAAVVSIVGWVVWVTIFLPVWFRVVAASLAR